MRRFAILAGSVMLLSSTGCTTLLKQAYHTAKGASGRYYELEVVNPDTLAGFEAIRFEPVTNSLGDHVPDDLLFELNEQVPAVIGDAALFGPSGRSLVVRAEIIHYNGRSGLSGALQSVMGGQECVCRVELADGDTGRRIGEAVCWGEVKSAVRRGAGELGKGVGKGLAKWLEDRLPKPDEETGEDGHGRDGEDRQRGDVARE